MASKHFCSNVAGELEFWSRKLHEFSSEIERIPSIDKYKLQPQIDQLHIIVTELDDRLCEMVNSCDSVDAVDTLPGEEGRSPRHSFAQSSGERFDYDFGG